MSIDNFNTTYDGGSFPLSATYDKTFEAVFLYSTGNTLYQYLRGFDADVILVSGTTYDFFKINTANYIPIQTDEYKFVNEKDLIFYKTTTGTISITGKSIIDNSLKSFNLQSKTILSTNSDYYYYRIGTPYLATGNRLNINPFSWFWEKYDIDAFDPSKHLLICYNERNQDSIDVKNYYMNSRPELATANILALNCSNEHSGSCIHTGEYVSQIRTPIWDYIENSGKPIRYVTMLYDIPTTIIFDNTYPSWSGGVFKWAPADLQILPTSGINYSVFCGSLSHDLTIDYPFFAHKKRNIYDFLNLNYLNIMTGYAPSSSPSSPYKTLFKDYISGYFFQSTSYISNRTGDIPRYSIERYSSQPFLVTHITARNKSDVIAYLRKISESPIKDTYYRRGSGANVNHIFVNDSGDSYESASPFHGITGRLKQYCPSVQIDWRNGIDSPSNPKITGGNMASFACFGTHTYPDGGVTLNANYTTNGSIKFTGYNWYLLGTVESYNGINIYWAKTGAHVPNPYFGSPFKFFASGAFGGFSYENCPVAFCGNIIEPGLTSAVNSMQTYVSWESGIPWIESAWIGLLNSVYGASNYTKIVIGDPLIVCR